MRTPCCEAVELSHRGFSQRRNTSVQTRIKKRAFFITHYTTMGIKITQNCCNSYMLLR